MNDAAISDEHALYDRLRAELDRRMPVGMPAGDDNAAVSLLRMLFSPREALVALHMSILPEKAGAIHRRMVKGGYPLSLEDVQSILEGMVGKGLIMGGGLFAKRGRFSLAQFAVGIYEFQVNRQTEEFARLAEAYHEKALAEEFFHDDRPVQLRTIPVNRSVGQERRVATYDDVTAIVARAREPLVVMDCVCKETRDLVAEPCRLSPIRNNCIMFGDSARFMLERKVPSARRVTRDELSAMLEVFRRAGFIVQPANSRDPGFVCMCCGCCCNVLRSYKKMADPSPFFASNYYAEVLDACNGCGRCVARCQMEAITVHEAKAVIARERCIGCGNCVDVCARKAMVLREKKRQKRPAANSRLLYVKILLRKKGLPGFAVFMARRLFGLKV